MRFVIDFVDTATAEEVSTYLAANSATVLETYDALGNVYLVEAAAEPAANAIVEHMQRDDLNPLQLLETVNFEPLSTQSNATADDDNWWKVALVSNIDYESPDFEIIRTGKGLPVYLLDSGVNASHPEFVDASIVQLYSKVEGDFTDVNGHGTSLASVIVGKQCGITDATIKSVKIFDGTDTYVSDLLAAFNAVADDYVANHVGRPGVVNLSWGIAQNSYVDQKIATLQQLGLIVVAAAGNSGIPVANVTPAAIPTVITVGSFGPDLMASDFSNYTGPSDTSYTEGATNYGVGLDIFCPGEAIRVAKLDGTLGYSAGTSIAAAIMSACAIVQCTRIGGAYTANNLEGWTNIALNSSNFSLLTLEGNYVNSPNRVPRIKITPYDGTEKRQVAGFYFVRVGESYAHRLVDPTAYDTVTITSMPAGASISENYVVGIAGPIAEGDLERRDITYVATKNGIEETYTINQVVFDPATRDHNAEGEAMLTELELYLYCYCNSTYCAPAVCCGGCDKTNGVCSECSLSNCGGGANHGACCETWFCQ